MLPGETRDRSDGLFLWLFFFFPGRVLREHVSGDEKAKEKDKGGGGEELRCDISRAVVVDMRAGRAAS